MAFETLLVALLVLGWNLLLQLKLSRESRLRRELALAFRVHLIERRDPRKAGN